MGKIRVNCESCGHGIDIDEDLAADALTCPACGTFTPIKREGAPPAPEKPQLQLKQEEPKLTLPRKDCPRCGTPADRDANICVQCGYDWRSGVRPGETSPTARLVQQALVLIGIIVVAAFVTVAFLAKRGSDERKAETAKAEEPVEEVQEEAAETPAGDEEEAVAEEPTEAPAIETAEVIEDEGWATPAEDPASMEARYRRRMRMRLDKEQPMFITQTEVGLRMASGIVYRGIFLGVENKAAVVTNATGRVEIPLTDLDRTSRVRCDQQYRDRFIEFSVRKRLRAAQRAQNPEKRGR